MALLFQQKQIIYRIIMGAAIYIFLTEKYLFYILQIYLINIIFIN